MDADLALAIELADIADPMSMARFGAQNLHVDQKSDASPVTEVDQAIERALRRKIDAERGHDAIYGEEFGETGSGSRCWLIDPIDGTKSYIRGTDLWATLIALKIDGVITVAVASVPALGQRYTAVRGEGAWLETQRLHVSAIDQIEKASLAHTSLSGFIQTEQGEQITALASQTWDAKGLGNSLSHLAVARGAADIGWSSRGSSWDFASLSLIVEEAGGKFFDGTRGQPNGTLAPAVSSNGLLQNAALAAAGLG